MGGSVASDISIKGHIAIVTGVRAVNSPLKKIGL